MHAAQSEKSGLITPSARSITDMLLPLENIASYSANLIANCDAHFEIGDSHYQLPRYLFVGPRGGDAPIRLGIFAGVYGNELESILALITFVKLLEAKPDLASGYCLFLYPICNPSGFEDDTRHSRSGKDLNREFWNDSHEPEVRLLQSEIVSHALNGIISLYANGTKNHFFGIERSGALTRPLIEPALQSVKKLSQHYDPPVFSSKREAIWKGGQGILSAPPKVRPKSFEIILETAHTHAAWQVVALVNILEEYRKFIAYAPNL